MDELTLNPFVRALRVDMKPGALLQSLLPYEAILVPTLSVFTDSGINATAIGESFLRNHVMRNLKKKGRRLEFVTVAGKKGSFSDDFTTVTVNDSSFRVLRRMSVDMIREALGEQVASNIAVDLFVISGAFHPLGDCHDNAAPAVFGAGNGNLVRHASAISASADATSASGGPRTSFAFDPDPAPGNSFRDFQNKITSDPKLRPFVKLIKPFLSRVQENAHGTNAIRVGHEEVRNFVSTTAEELVSVADVWPESMSGDTVREDMERYVMLKLYDSTFVADPRDADLQLRRNSTAAALLDPNGTVGNSDTIRRTWSRAVDVLQSLNTYRCPRDKLVCVMNSHAAIRALIGTSIKAAAANGLGPSGAAAGATDPKTATEQVLPAAIRVLVAQQNLPNLVANLNFIENYRSRSKLIGDAVRTLDMTRNAVELLLASPPTQVAHDIACVNETLALGSGGRAAPFQPPPPQLPQPPAAQATTADETPRQVPATANAAPRPAAAPVAQSSVGVASHGNDSGRETGIVGRVPMDRIAIVDDEELSAREQIDANHEQAIEAAEREWAEELRRREDAETQLAAVEADWLAAQSASQQLARSHEELLDQQDAQRLAKWQAELASQSSANDAVFVAGKRAWTALAQESDRVYDAASKLQVAMHQSELGANRELKRREALHTEALNRLRAALQTAAAEMETGVASLDERVRGVRADAEEGRASAQTLIRDGMDQLARQRAELAERERLLDERRIAMESHFASRDEQLCAREEKLSADYAALHADVDEREQQAYDRIGARTQLLTELQHDANTALQTLEARALEIDAQHAAASEELQRRQSAFETYVAQARMALQSEVAEAENRAAVAEAASREAKESADARLKEVQRQTSVAETQIRDRTSALDRRQAEMERRIRNHAASEERAAKQHQQRSDELTRRASDDRATVADIQANLKAREAELDAAARALEQKRVKIEQSAAAREAAAAERVRSVRAHCRSEFDTAVQVLAETDAVHAVTDFNSLRMSDLENLWSTMRAFRKVKAQFNEVVTKFAQEDADIEAKEERAVAGQSSMAR